MCSATAPRRRASVSVSTRRPCACGPTTRPTQTASNRPSCGPDLGGLNGIFPADERAYCKGQKRPAIHYAARWAAKEAVSKAFGTGIGEVLNWKDIEVRRRASGEPELVLHGRGKAFAEENGIGHLKISLTHAKSYAAANAVAIGD